MAITMHAQRAVNFHLPFLYISQRSCDSLHHASHRQEGHQHTVFCRPRTPSAKLTSSQNQHPRNAPAPWQSRCMPGERSTPTCLSFICPNGVVTASIMYHIARSSGRPSTHCVLSSEDAQIDFLPTCTRQLPKMAPARERGEGTSSQAQ